MIGMIYLITKKTFQIRKNRASDRNDISESLEDCPETNKKHSKNISRKLVH